MICSHCCKEESERENICCRCNEKYGDIMADETDRQGWEDFLVKNNMKITDL